LSLEDGMTAETILVVDDNKQIGNFMARTILPSLGFQTMVAYDGKTALDIVRKNHISLMLLDFQLGETTGLEILRHLIKEGYTIPTILVTAEGSEQIAVDAFRLGVHDYLTKPVDADNLEAAISRALAESRLRKEKTTLTQQLTEQVSWLKVLSRVGQSVTSILELDEVLRRIVEAGVLLTQADEGFLALLDDSSGQLYLRAVKNMEEEKSKTLRLPVTDSLVGSVLQSKRPLRMSQSMENLPLKVSTGFLVHSLIHVPLISKGKTLGVLSVDNHKSKRDFKKKDESLLTSLADYASVALENANLYQQARQEIQERKRVAQALRVSEERYALAVRGANEGLWDWNLTDNTIYFSPRWKSMLGYSEDEIENNPDEWFKRIHAEDLARMKLDFSAHCEGVTSHFENEHRMLHKDESYRWMLTRGLAVWNGNGKATRMAGSLADITDRKTAEQKLLHDAFHDALTGLPNRTLFMDRLRYAVERAKRRDDYLFAVLFLDLDRFKDINDSLGHFVGDKLLIAIANRLQKDLRSTDTVARLGGDEFVILLEDISDISDATRIADQLQDELTSSNHLIEHDVFITTSIGIVLSVTGYNRPEEVLRDADIAMYRAKALGKARYEIFDPTMRDLIMERLELEGDLRRALENEELVPYYQPIVSLDTGRTMGFEALVRWNHPKRGLLTPDAFISMAEETGLVIAIDRLVLREACRQLVEWQDMYNSDPPLTISVNLSVKQVTQPDMIEFIQHTLDETGLSPRCLKLEITESVIMDNFEYTASVFGKIQNMGVQIEIDDFGIGYSSLSYLSHFPINALKIDRSFISRMVNNGSHLKIVQAIVMLAHGLGMNVTAEGVENENQLSVIKSLGCELAQGYIVSKPTSKVEAKEFILKKLFD
jgi:diguanylate cyclase (GGDEF)-like protein/PAS domain S-box-containing protein